MEFFTIFVTAMPGGTPARAVNDARAGEARRTDELADQGHLTPAVAVGGPAGRIASAGLWRSQDGGQIHPTTVGPAHEQPRGEISRPPGKPARITLQAQSHAIVADATQGDGCVSSF